MRIIYHKVVNTKLGQQIPELYNITTSVLDEWMIDRWVVGWLDSGSMDGWIGDGIIAPFTFGPPPLPLPCLSLISRLGERPPNSVPPQTF